MGNERYHDAGYEGYLNAGYEGYLNAGYGGYPNAGYEGHRGYGLMTEVEMRREEGCRYNWPYDGVVE